MNTAVITNAGAGVKVRVLNNNTYNITCR